MRSLSVEKGADRFDHPVPVIFRQSVIHGKPHETVSLAGREAVLPVESAEFAP